MSETLSITTRIKTFIVKLLVTDFVSQRPSSITTRIKTDYETAYGFIRRCQETLFHYNKD